MGKKHGVKIMAFLALFGIIIGIIGTGLLIIFDNGASNNDTELTQEEYKKLIKQINSNSGTIETKTGVKIGTGEIN